MRVRGALLAALLGAAGCIQVERGAGGAAAAAVDPEAGEVPFRMAGVNEAAVLVPVHVNGEGPFDLVLDTGATFTCLDVARAEALQLPERRGAVGVGAGVGGTGRLRLVRIDSLRVGGARAAGLTGCVLDLAHVAVVGVEADGLLGLDFLREFRVTLDFERNVLRLEDPAAAQ
jgi:predicted aspartyl protease